MKKGLIYSTCYFGGQYGVQHGRRCEFWFDYYRQYLSEYELISFHDGPIPENAIDRDKYNIVELTPHLSGGEFAHIPGWYRSFKSGLLYAEEKGYELVSHIETDLYFKKNSISKLKEYLEKPGYYSGWCYHKFFEEALQIINDAEIRKKLINFISDKQLYVKGVPGKFFMQHIACPEIVFKGERLEKNIEGLLREPSLEYFAQFWYESWAQYL